MTDLARPKDAVERLEEVLSAQSRGLIRQPQSADLRALLSERRALLSERRKLIEALEGLLPALFRLDHHDRGMFADEEAAAIAVLSGSETNAC